jgi:predicted MFS family arabinose efflux permease
MVFNGSILGVGGVAGSALGGVLIGLSGYAALGVVFAILALGSGVAMLLASRQASLRQG